MHAPIPCRPPQFSRLQEAQYPDYGYDEYEGYYDSPSQHRNHHSSRKRRGSYDRSAEKMEKRYKRDMKQMEKDKEMLQWQLDQAKAQLQAGNNSQRNGGGSSSFLPAPTDQDRRSSSPLQRERQSSAAPDLPPPRTNTFRRETGNTFGQYEARPQQEKRSQQPSSSSLREVEPEAEQIPSSSYAPVPAGKKVTLGKHTFDPPPPVPREGDTIPPLNSKQGMGMLSLTALRKFRFYPPIFEQESQEADILYFCF